MVAKCANSACNREFRDLSKGRIRNKTALKALALTQ